MRKKGSAKKPKGTTRKPKRRRRKLVPVGAGGDDGDDTATGVDCNDDPGEGDEADGGDEDGKTASTSGVDSDGFAFECEVMAPVAEPASPEPGRGPDFELKAIVEQWAVSAGISRLKTG